MNEQQVNALIAALQEETKAKKEQTAALTRLAESMNRWSLFLLMHSAMTWETLISSKKMRTKTISAIGGNYAGR